MTVNSQTGLPARKFSKISDTLEIKMKLRLKKAFSQQKGLYN